ncbi:MAG TPA: hypothetical protein VK574_13425 [Terracidiphilus sp.]|nr:hypothetical protein [Terracidiphilus sp.]
MSTDTQFVFDETSFVSGATGNMLEQRCGYGITAPATGRVVIIGGDSTTNATGTNTAEIFEPDSSIYITLPKTLIAANATMNLTVDPSTVGTVTWGVKYGTITSAGVYTAPATNPNGASDKITTIQEPVTATASGATAAAPFTVVFSQPSSNTNSRLPSHRRAAQQ